MPHRTFFAFMAPSILAMILFITLPIFSVIVQSFYQKHEAVVVTVENCTPFGCESQTKVDTEAVAKLQAEAPMGQFAGWDNYTNRNHLALDELAQIWAEGGDMLSKVMNLTVSSS